MRSVIQNVIQYPPKPYYLLAVDNSDNTMMRVAKVCVPRKVSLWSSSLVDGTEVIL